MGYYLLDNPNPHAAGGFHGYPDRRSRVRLVVVHTTENAFDEIGPDTGAENVAAYLARTDRQASYHDVFDSDSHVRLLPWEFTAFGARGYNSDAIHLAFAGRASDWHTLTPTQIAGRLDVGADVARDALAFAGLPAVHLDDDDAQGGGRGLAGHGQLDPDRRTDPGAGFPWRQFTDLITQEDDMRPPSEWAEDIWAWALKVGLVNPPDHDHPTDPHDDVQKQEDIALLHRYHHKVIGPVVADLRSRIADAGGPSQGVTLDEVFAELDRRLAD